MNLKSVGSSPARNKAPLPRVDQRHGLQRVSCERPSRAYGTLFPHAAPAIPVLAPPIFLPCATPLALRFAAAGMRPAELEITVCLLRSGFILLLPDISLQSPEKRLFIDHHHLPPYYTAEASSFPQRLNTTPVKYRY